MVAQLSGTVTRLHHHARPYPLLPLQAKPLLVHIFIAPTAMPVLTNQEVRRAANRKVCVASRASAAMTREPGSSSAIVTHAANWKNAPSKNRVDPPPMLSSLLDRTVQRASSARSQTNVPPLPTLKEPRQNASRRPLLQAHLSRNLPTL